MKQIAFVDDDQRILDGLKRMLHGCRNTWDINVYSSGADLLNDMSGKTFDIIVSDMRMPKMNGAELLSIVKEKSPGTLRIILSGYADDEMVLESVQAAHQFIAKPAEKEQITNIISRGLRLQQALNDEHIRSVLGSVESLPTLPSIYQELMGEIAKDEMSLESIGGIIEKDMALSSSLLRLVNSAFFFLSRHIETPGQAATILGVNTIKNLALSNGVFQAFKGKSNDYQQLERLNAESQRVGLLAGKLAQVSDLSTRGKDHAQIAGMMVNLGGLLKIQFASELSDVNGGDTHSGILGSYLLGIWAMPYPVVEAVRWYEQPSLSSIDELSPLAIVHAAYAMVAMFQANNEIDLTSELIDIEYLELVVGPKVIEQWQVLAENFLNSEE